MSAVPAPSETGFPMPRKITVLANKPAADAGSGATDFAFLELSETLKRLPDTQITLFGNETFCAPHSFQTNLLAACRQLMASGEANAEKIIASAKNSDALLLGDVRGLSTVEWIPALTLSRCPTPPAMARSRADSLRPRALNSPTKATRRGATASLP